MKALRGLSPAMSTLLRPSALKPTTPGLTVSNRFLRAGLRGEPYLPKGLGRDHSWHVSNLPKMKLDKAASIDPETKHELASTAVIGAAGAATSALTHKLTSGGLVKNTAGKAALIGGGLGLLGDYAAVKLNKKLSPDAQPNKGHTMDKQAALNSLVDAGVNFDLAVAIVKQASVTDYGRAGISPAWMQESVANRHGRVAFHSDKDANAAHANGVLRAQGRSLVEGLAGGAAGLAAGHGVAHLAARFGKTPRIVSPVGAAIGGGVGLLGGAIHGAHASLKNQVRDAHKKYSD